MKVAFLLALACCGTAQPYEEYRPAKLSQYDRESHGFVEPLDFSSLFGAKHMGSAASSTNVKTVIKPAEPAAVTTPVQQSYFESFPLESKRSFQIAEAAAYHYPRQSEAEEEESQREEDEEEEAQSRYGPVTSSYRKPGRDTDEDDPNCERVSNVKADDISTGRYRRSPSNCLFCKNPVTGAKYSKCTFNNTPDKKSSYYKGASESYSTHDAGDTGGRARDRRQILKYSHKPRQFDEAVEYQSSNFKEVQRPADTQKDFERDYAEEYDKVKQMAQSQYKETRAKPKNCKVVQRDDMTCNVCGDEKTGGTFESCSYVSAPKNVKYAYTNDKKYDSNDDSGEEQEEEEEKPKPKPKKSNYRGKERKAIEASATSDNRRDIQDDDSNDKDVEGSDKRYEEYFSHLFPEYAAASDQKDQVHERGSGYKSFFRNEEPKKDVAKVLAEFAEKDRSACKKIMRDKLTCYRCADKNGAVREECAYSSSAQPEASHMAYREVKQYQTGPAAEDDAPQEKTGKRPRSSRARQPSTSAAEDNQETRQNESKQRVQRENKDESQEIEPVEIELAEEYAAQETKPRYSRELGMMLANYMLERSEQEKDFDKSMSAGR